MTNNIKINVKAFFGDEEMVLSFPGNWDVKECRIAGHNRPPLSDDQLRSTLQKPFGTGRLKDIAQGKNQVCILFDDLPKPTPTHVLVPFVLEELHEGGISDDQIRFVCAPGTHRPLIHSEFVAKLGKEIVDKYPVYNHSIWENVVFKGKTGNGTPVYLNREFDSCNLRIAIGSIFPHPSAGFGGGAKMILPGICGIETIAYHHKNMASKTGSMLGQIDNNLFRSDIEEAALFCGLHFKVDAVLNNRREIVGLFAGDMIKEHRAGVELARKLYETETVSDRDVVIINTYPDEFQLGRSMGCVPGSLREGGDVVIIIHAKGGQALHQLRGRFGTDYGGRLYAPVSIYKRIGNVGRIIALAPELSRYDRDMIGPTEKVTVCDTWTGALAELAERHGAGTKVGVYPYAPLQVPFAKNSG
ncbi:lactate racemase domain-containing protein [Chloroflexota bacterium]